MSYLEPILVHPVRRQNFGDTVAQTCNPHLIPCLIMITSSETLGCSSGKSQSSMNQSKHLKSETNMQIILFAKKKSKATLLLVGSR